MIAGLPDGLTRGEGAELARCIERATPIELPELLRKAEVHVECVARARERRAFVNLALAQAILGAIRAVIADWDRVPASARSSCRGMILYFCEGADEEDDLDSPIGFEDDAEVLNACLRLAGLPELCISTEDYDDA